MKINIPERLREFEQRQEFRRENGLPALDRTQELARLRILVKREREAAFERFCHVEAPALYRKVQARVLAYHRGLRNNPNWLPTGMLSGGGFMFETCCRNCMLILYQRRKRRNK
jgi:hypothetical protein